MGTAKRIHIYYVYEHTVCSAYMEEYHRPPKDSSNARPCNDVSHWAQHSGLCLEFRGCRGSRLGDTGLITTHLPYADLLRTQSSFVDAPCPASKIFTRHTLSTIHIHSTYYVALLRCRECPKLEGSGDVDCGKRKEGSTYGLGFLSSSDLSFYCSDYGQAGGH